MAGAFAQHAVDSLAEIFQDVKRNKCLDSTGKVAAVDPVAAPSCQILVAQRQGYRACQYPSVLVVGVVAAKLRSAGAEK